MTDVLFRDKVPSSTPPTTSVLQPNKAEARQEEVVFDAQNVDLNDLIEGDASAEDNDVGDDSTRCFSGTMLELESQVNLACPVLRDILSEKGVDSNILVKKSEVIEMNDDSSEEDSDDLEDDDLWRMEFH